MLKSRFFVSFITHQKKIIYAFLALFILFNRNVHVQAQLSPQSEISILTCAPGEELYSIFGHTALRVRDTTFQKDFIFNYGTFDFNTPNFYLKFMQGELDYFLSVTTFDSFMREYHHQKRSVVEQKLNLTNDEKERIIDALIKNALPENRAYHYHFFYDNCATRIRDIVATNILPPLKFNTLTGNQINFSYRDAIDIYLANSVWTKFGLALILGEPTDDILTSQTIQFLPDYLYEQFGSVEKENFIPFVSEEVTLLQFENNFNSSPLTPLLLFWGLFLLITLLSFWEIRNKKWIQMVNLLVFIPVTLLGVLIIFLWFFTSHSVTGPNWNLLWATPLSLFMLFPSLLKQKKFQWIPWLIIGSNIVMLFIFPIIPQKIPVALIPIWLIIASRTSVYLYNKQHKSEHIA